MSDSVFGQDWLIVDLEATCWGKDDLHRPKPQPGRRYANEIIEVGAALFNPQSGELVKEYQTFVQPVFHARLTGFCEDLTGIRQSDVDGAPLFPEVLDELVVHFELDGEGDPWFASWGGYDYFQLLDDCHKHGCPFPFEEDNHLNLKTEFPQWAGWQRKAGLQNALERAGLAFEGRPHRAIDDVRNIVRLCRELLTPGATGSRPLGSEG